MSGKPPAPPSGGAKAPRIHGGSKMTGVANSDSVKSLFSDGSAITAGTTGTTPGESDKPLSAGRADGGMLGSSSAVSVASGVSSTKPSRSSQTGGVKTNSTNYTGAGKTTGSKTSKTSLLKGLQMNTKKIKERFDPNKSTISNATSVASGVNRRRSGNGIPGIGISGSASKTTSTGGSGKRFPLGKKGQNGILLAGKAPPRSPGKAPPRRASANLPLTSSTGMTKRSSGGGVLTPTDVVKKSSGMSYNIGMSNISNLVATSPSFPVMSSSSAELNASSGNRANDYRNTYTYGGDGNKKSTTTKTTPPKRTTATTPDRSGPPLRISSETPHSTPNKSANHNSGVKSVRSSGTPPGNSTLPKRRTTPEKKSTSPKNTASKTGTTATTYQKRAVSSNQSSNQPSKYVDTEPRVGAPPRVRSWMPKSSATSSTKGSSNGVSNAAKKPTALHNRRVSTDGHVPKPKRSRRSRNSKSLGALHAVTNSVWNAMTYVTGIGSPSSTAAGEVDKLSRTASTMVAGSSMNETIPKAKPFRYIANSFVNFKKKGDSGPRIGTWDSGRDSPKDSARESAASNRESSRRSSGAATREKPASNSPSTSGPRPSPSSIPVRKGGVMKGSMPKTSTSSVSKTDKSVLKTNVNLPKPKVPSNIQTNAVSMSGTSNSNVPRSGTSDMPGSGVSIDSARPPSGLSKFKKTARKVIVMHVIQEQGLRLHRKTKFMNNLDEGMRPLWIGLFMSIMCFAGVLSADTKTGLFHSSAVGIYSVLKAGVSPNRVTESENLVAASTLETVEKRNPIMSKEHIARKLKLGELDVVARGTQQHAKDEELRAEAQEYLEKKVDENRAFDDLGNLVNGGDITLSAQTAEHNNSNNTSENDVITYGNHNRNYTKDDFEPYPFSYVWIVTLATFLGKVGCLFVHYIYDFLYDCFYHSGKDTCMLGSSENREENYRGSSFYKLWSYCLLLIIGLTEMAGSTLSSMALNAGLSTTLFVVFKSSKIVFVAITSVLVLGAHISRPQCMGLLILFMAMYVSTLAEKKHKGPAGDPVIHSGRQQFLFESFGGFNQTGFLGAGRGGAVTSLPQRNLNQFLYEQPVDFGIITSNNSNIIRDDINSFENQFVDSHSEVITVQSVINAIMRWFKGVYDDLQDELNGGAENSFLAIVLIIASEFSHGVQIVLQEVCAKRYEMDPMVIVGGSALSGFASTIVSCVTLSDQVEPCIKGQKQVEGDRPICMHPTVDFRDGLIMMLNNPLVGLFFWVHIFSLLCNDLVAVYISKHVNSLCRVMVDALKLAVLWTVGKVLWELEIFNDTLAEPWIQSDFQNGKFTGSYLMFPVIICIFYGTLVFQSGVLIPVKYDSAQGKIVLVSVRKKSPDRKSRKSSIVLPVQPQPLSGAVDSTVEIVEDSRRDSDSIKDKYDTDRDRIRISSSSKAANKSKLKFESPLAKVGTTSAMMKKPLLSHDSIGQFEYPVSGASGAASSVTSGLQISNASEVESSLNSMARSDIEDDSSDEEDHTRVRLTGIDHGMNFRRRVSLAVNRMSARDTGEDV